MPLTSYMQKQILDYLLGGAAPTQPSNRWISWATGSPNDNGASDGPFVSRASWNAAAANSPQGSATNQSSVINQTMTGAGTATVIGWNLWDASAGGTRLAYGTLSASALIATANSVRMSAGIMKLIIS
jgi:hypothetical protein